MLATLRRGFVLLQVLGLLLSLYQTAITLAGRMRRPSHDRAPGRRVRFILLVCARNEEAVICGIVRELLTQDYPAGCRRVIAVAHNCTDGTAQVARAAGAEVLEVETATPGKVFGMRAAIETIDLAGVDYVGVFDADASVPPDLLLMVSEHVGHEVGIQVEVQSRAAPTAVAAGYGLARQARNVFWWRPREALGLGTTASGSGYFLRPDALIATLRGARTLTEDLEITARLYANGFHITYFSGTSVRVEEPPALGVSLRQRLRWVRGHLGVIRYEFPALLSHTARGDLRALDFALYLIAPTRVLTRTGASLVLLLGLACRGWAAPRRLALLACTGEWVVPIVIGLRERLVEPNPGGLLVAVRMALLNLLWFPIGIWGLITASRVAWTPMTRRSAAGGTDAVDG